MVFNAIDKESYQRNTQPSLSKDKRDKYKMYSHVFKQLILAFQ